MRAKLNCWIVAMWLWAATRFRQYAWVSRSHSLKGWLPHFGYAERRRWRNMMVIEYIPPRRRLWSLSDLGCVFSGHYRVWHFRVLAVRRFSTKEQAMADRYSGARK